AFVVAAGAVLQVDAAIVQSNANDALTLSGAGTVLLNGANTHTKATTVAAGTTIGGTGSITSSAVTLNGSKILANASGEALTLSTVSGSADIVVPEGFPETTTAVLKTNSASAPTLTPPAMYRLQQSANTAEKTYSLEWSPDTSLVADVSGSCAFSELTWKRLDNSPISGTIDWATVETITLHIFEDATLSGVPALKADGQLVLDFTAATEKTLTLEATESRTLPAVTIAGTVGGNLLADSTTFTLTSLVAASGCPYLGTSPELLGTLWGTLSEDVPKTFDGSATLGLLCAESGSSFDNHLTLSVASKSIRIVSGTFKPSRTAVFGDTAASAKIRVDAGAVLDVNGQGVTCQLTLDGGTVKNTGAAIGDHLQQLSTITLTADSVIENTATAYSIASGYNGHNLTLNGHTLIKRGNGTFSFYNATVISDGGHIVVESGTLQLADKNEKSASISGTVTFEQVGGTLTLSDAYTIAANSTLTFKGNVTVTGALTVGSNTGVTIAYDGDVVPTSGLASLDTCEQVTFTETFWKAVETKTVATGTVFTLATSYGSDTAPTLKEAKTGYALEAQVTSAADAETTTYALVLTYSGAISDVTAVQATVSGDANWSELTWQDMSGNVVTPMWGVVTSVTLAAEAEATVTLDLPLANLTSLTVAESASTLTLTGKSLSACPFSTFALKGSLTLESAMLPSIPTCLSGTGTLTFKDAGTVTSTAAGGDSTFAYNSFTGRWVIESGTTLNLAGGGGQKGQLAKSDIEGSGQIVVKTGATVKLSANHVFGWKDIDAQYDRTVLVLDGGALVNNAEQYLRRTFELKNGATLSDPNGKFWLARAGRLLVSEGSATILNSGSGPKFGCNGSASGSAPSQIEVCEGATLTVEASLSDQNDKYASVTLSGAGKILFNGVNTYTKETTVAAETTIGGTGSIASAVTFEAGAKLRVDPAAEAPLTLNGAIAGTAQIVLASAPTELSTAAVTTESGTLSLENFTVPEGDYTLTLSEDSKTLYVNFSGAVYTTLNATVDGSITTWSQLPWKDSNDDSDAKNINWAFVKEVTLNLSDDVTLSVDVALPKLATLSAWAAYDVRLVKGRTLSAAPFSALATITTSANLDFDEGTMAKAPASILPYAVTVRFADSLAEAVQGTVTTGHDNGFANGMVAFDGANTFTAPVTVKKGATLAGSGSLAAAVTFEAGSAVLADGAALTVGTVTVADGATVTVTPAAGLADATVLVAANALTESDFTEPTGYTRMVVEGTTLKLSRNLTLEVKYQDEAVETVLSSEVKQQIREQVCKVAGTAVTGTITTTIEVLHADGSTEKAVEAAALEGLLTCFKNHTAATVEGTTATVTVCYDFGVSHITVDAARAVIVTAKVEGQSAEVDFAEGVSFSVVDMNTGMVWSMAPGDLLEQTLGEVRFKIPADRLDDANDTNSQKLLEDFIGTRALRVKVTR
ncbi:MAG: hypothetical protein ACI4QJ_03745, partial [Candidatus Spyradenecus sp.]